MSLQTKRFLSLAAAIPGASGPSMRVSTITPDRDGDRIFPEGCDAKHAQKNLPIMFGHDYRALPVGTGTGLTITPGKWIDATFRWLENDQFAERVKNAFDQGILRAASIGFKPLARVPNEFGGFDITKWELLEVSLVPVPANPEAVRSLKTLGLLEPERRSDRETFIRDLAALDYAPTQIAPALIKRVLTEALPIVIAETAAAETVKMLRYYAGCIDVD